MFIGGEPTPSRTICIQCAIWILEKSTWSHSCSTDVLQIELNRVYVINPNRYCMKYGLENSAVNDLTELSKYYYVDPWLA